MKNKKDAIEYHVCIEDDEIEEDLTESSNTVTTSACMDPEAAAIMADEMAAHQRKLGIVHPAQAKASSLPARPASPSPPVSVPPSPAHAKPAPSGSASAVPVAGAAQVPGTLGGGNLAAAGGAKKAVLPKATPAGGKPADSPELQRLAAAKAAAMALSPQPKAVEPKASAKASAGAKKRKTENKDPVLQARLKKGRLDKQKEPKEMAKKLSAKTTTEILSIEELMLDMSKEKKLNHETKTSYEQYFSGALPKLRKFRDEAEALSVGKRVVDDLAKDKDVELTIGELDKRTTELIEKCKDQVNGIRGLLLGFAKQQRAKERAAALQRMKEETAKADAEDKQNALTQAA